MNNGSELRKRDLKLVKRTLRGDNDAYALLMSYYKNRVYYFGKSFFHNDTDSEDFVQDVFIKAYTHLPTFKGKASFSTWLMKIAYSIAVNSINRRKDYLPLLEEVPIVDADYTPEEREVRRLTQEAIQSAIKTLPSTYSLCIELYFYYDIQYADISEITNIPLNTVKSNIHRAKKILKEKLEDYYE